MAARPDFDIPLVDLAGDTERQIAVDRESGQYLGHPTTVLRPDGRTILIVYPKGHGRGAIVLKRSDDGGRTWGERLPVPDSWATSQEVPTLYPVVDASGRRRLIMFSGLYPIRMAVSEDEGDTWSELAAIGDYGGIVAMADLVQLRSGAHMALFHDDGRFLHNSGETSGAMHVYRVLSVDGGLSWSQPEVVTTHARAHLCEPGVVRSPDGRQLCLLLRETSRQLNSMVIFSDDEGETWTDPMELPGALTGDRHQAVYGPDGRLFISFRDTCLDTPTEGDWVGWIGTYEDISAGRQGQYRLRLMENHKNGDCAYPAIEVLPDGTIFTTTYGHWVEGEAPFIAGLHFSLDEIDSLAARGAT